MSAWDDICGGHVGSQLPVWNSSTEDFGHCFEQLVFVCPCHVILGIISIYFIGLYRHMHVEYAPPKHMTVRLLTVLLLVCLPLLQLLLSLTVEPQSPPIIDIVTQCLRAAVWLLHLIFVMKLLQASCVTSSRGPCAAVVAFMLCPVCWVIELRTIILRLETSNISAFETGFQLSTGVLYIVYLCSLVPRYIPEQSNERSYLLGNRNNQEPSLGTAEDSANFLSKLFFGWVQPLMAKGAKKNIHNANDLFDLPCKLKTHSIENVFLEASKTKPSNESLTHVINSSPNDFGERSLLNINASSDDVGTPSINSDTRDSGLADHSIQNGDEQEQSLLRNMHKAFGTEYYAIGILKLFADGLGFTGPLLLNLLLSFMENASEPIQHGYLYAAGLLLSTLLCAIFNSQFDYQVQCVGLKLRAAVITMIYRKTLTVNSVSLSQFSSGQVVNFMSTDSDRIVNFCPSFHQFWSLPFQIAVSLFLLYQQIGISFLAGLGFAVLLIPVNRWLAIKIGELSTDMMAQKDARVKLMNEILGGIRVIKYHAWEKHFSREINKQRAGELKSLKGRKYLDAFCVYFWATTPVLISILSFTTYSLLGHKLTASKVFTSIALFNMLISPLNAFPWVINGLMEAWVSVKRIQAFFQLKQLDLKHFYQICKVPEDHVLSVEKSYFSWNADQEELGNNSGHIFLKDINLNIKKGQLVGIIGTVGSGKSSVLSAILAEMQQKSGKVSITNLDDGFGYVAQESWLQHGTIRENILFGSAYREEKYLQVLDACALLDDLKVLPSGDKTEIGERGVTLSGGQKARVALARAVYQNKDVYLLDDPMAAVDTHVARQIFNECIMGILADKTHIMCTHHTEYLHQADLVVVMDGGMIVKTGPPESVFGELNVLKSNGSNNSNIPETKDDSESGVPSVLVDEEEQESGVVRLQVYKAYWSAVGPILAFSVLLALLLMQASRNINDWWLSYWISNTKNTTSPEGFHSLQQTGTSYASVHPGDDVNFYLMVYGILAGSNTVFTLLRAFLFAYGGICAATVVHVRLLDTILKAPLSFFDTTPLGRIINRFSSDVYSIDDSLPFIMNILLAQIYAILGTIAITCYGLPWFAVLLLPLSVVYYFIQYYYRFSSREIKRISSVTLSPIYAHFSESVLGLSTIRSFRQTARFTTQNRNYLDINQRAQFSGIAASAWLSIRLKMLGVAMVTGVAFIAVLEHHFRSVDPGLVGLAISYALSVTNLLGGVVQSFTETEKQMVAMERAQQYIDGTPFERQDGILRVPPYWPIQGTIYFHRVSLRYRPNLPLALSNVTFETKPAEKLGIVGRTGSGKSSLFLSLFRMVECCDGIISIDGIGVTHIGLQELRSRLAIIPQDPFLFSGSVRFNLDPTELFSDNQLLTMLRRCHMAVAVEQLGGLDGDVGERGKHFSVGERQLLCLARALLSKAKIICIDEATASVDVETDELLQRTIQEEFKDSTVLTIAHRIQTVMNCDRVLVMHQGQVAEIDSPIELLNNDKSLFYSLVHGHS